MNPSSELRVKVLQTMHLSVSERLALPGGRLPFSSLVRAAEALLAEESWLPSSLKDATSLNGVVVEARGTEYWIHECHELGVGRFGAVASRRAATLEEAVRALLAANGGSVIDGIAVDYDK